MNHEVRMPDEKKKKLLLRAEEFKKYIQTPTATN